jgi:hypothetical protein
MTITVTAKRAFFLLCVQAVLLTACQEEASDPSLIKFISIRNLDREMKISRQAWDQILEETINDKTPIQFSQATDGNIVIDTEGFYVLVLLLPFNPDDTWESDITADFQKLNDLMDYGQGYALVKIHNGAGKQALLTLSKQIDEVGIYWSGKGVSQEGSNAAIKYSVCSLLITPDARFIIRGDFSWWNLPETTVAEMQEFPLDYGYAYGLDMTVEELLGWHTQDYLDFIKDMKSEKGGMLSVFKVDESGETMPQTLLPDEFINDLVGRFE